MDTYTARRRAAALISVVAFGLGVSACGTDDPGSSGEHGGHGSAQSDGSDDATEAADHNDADVTFAQQMIPHHRQAVEMAGLAPSRAGSEVTDLAARISAAQDPEIATMTSWLEEWGEEVPAEDSGHADHGGTEGMMSAEDMTALAGLSGDAFDEAFLTMMIEHHEGAITMAEGVLGDGKSADVADLAQQISDAQRAEVDEMQDMLD
ncbi:DUF305 domain-containing protein [Mumia sp. DW29H23]|uniref:DUF305 domain-containing protein n=1 Tax=Mumia sp. DW29H23 TaxID=3421241 RepID=UPI003D683E63